MLGRHRPTISAPRLGCVRLLLRANGGLSLDLGLSVAAHKDAASMHVIVIHPQVELKHVLNGLLLLLLLT